MRTRHLSEFEKNISEINNNFSHAIFVFRQFNIDNSERVSAHAGKLTMEVYPKNEYACQFNVRLTEIDGQAQKTLDYVLDTFFVFTNTQFEVYLKDVYLFIKRNFLTELPEIPESKVYSTILENLNINIEADIENLFVSTYEYFKLRRNAILHRHKDRRFQGALESLTTGSFKKDKKNKLFRDNQFNGAELNLNWTQYKLMLKDRRLMGYKIESFDFSLRNASRFSTHDLIDVFNFYRLYAGRIDTVILQKIPRTSLLSFCLSKYEESYGNLKSNTFEQFSKQFGRICKFELNLKVDRIEIGNLYNGA